MYDWTQLTPDEQKAFEGGQEAWDGLDEESQTSCYARLLEVRIASSPDGVEKRITPLNEANNPFGYRTAFVRESRSLGFRVTRNYVFTPLERDGEVVGWNRTGEIITIDDVDPAKKETLPVSETLHTIAVEAVALPVDTKTPAVVK